MEPRARATRHKSHANFTTELQTMLYAFGAPSPPPHLLQNKPPDASNPPPQLPATLRLLDEIVTDFVVETCHAAVAIAEASRRAKLKLSDFEWAIRGDGRKLGHVLGMMGKRREQLAARKPVNLGGNGGVEGTRWGVDELVALGEVVGEEGTGKGKGRGRGRRKNGKRKLGEVEGVGDGEGMGQVGNGEFAGGGGVVVGGDDDEDDDDDLDVGGGTGMGGTLGPNLDGDGEQTLLEDGLDDERERPAKRAKGGGGADHGLGAG